MTLMLLDLLKGLLLEVFKTTIGPLLRRLRGRSRTERDFKQSRRSRKPKRESPEPGISKS